MANPWPVDGWQISHGCDYHGDRYDYHGDYNVASIQHMFSPPTHQTSILEGCGNMGYPSETHPKSNLVKSDFMQNIQFSCEIVLKICTEHGSNTVVLCAKFQKISQLSIKLRANDISWDKSSGPVSDRYPVLEGLEDPDMIYRSYMYNWSIHITPTCTTAHALVKVCQASTSSIAAIYIQHKTLPNLFNKCALP